MRRLAKKTKLFGMGLFTKATGLKILICGILMLVFVKKTVYDNSVITDYISISKINKSVYGEVSRSRLNGWDSRNDSYKFPYAYSFKLRKNNTFLTICLDPDPDEGTMYCIFYLVIFCIEI